MNILIERTHRKLCCALLSAAMLTTTTAHALFYIDNEGLEKDAVARTHQVQQRNTPDGFSVLSDKTVSVLHEIGKGTAQSDNSFGSDLPLADAITMIMPDKWIAYVDERVKQSESVDWSSENKPWTENLRSIGLNYGYKFLVDWNQRLIQISQDTNFNRVIDNTPLELEDTVNGRKVYVYSSNPLDGGGVLIVGGQSMPIKIRK